MLSRFAPAGSWQIVLLRGTGAEPSIDEDGDAVKAAIQRLRRSPNKGRWAVPYGSLAALGRTQSAAQ